MRLFSNQEFKKSKHNSTKSSHPLQNELKTGKTLEQWFSNFSNYSTWWSSTTYFLASGFPGGIYVMENKLSQKLNIHVLCIIYILIKLTSRTSNSNLLQPPETLRSPPDLQSPKGPRTLVLEPLLQSI